MDRLQELVRLHRMGTGAREVARLLRMSPNTERGYRLALTAQGLLQGTVDELPSLEELKAAVLAEKPKAPVPSQQVSKIERWRPELEEMVKKGLSPKAAWRRLRELHRQQFHGTYAQVKRLHKAIRQSRGVDPNEVAIPVETSPGHTAQVDFGYVGRLYDEESRTLRRAWVFLMVLGYSRHAVARIVFDQKSETWLRVHQECFAELGGVVEVVVPDNLKAAVIRAAFGLGDNPALNRSYRELARHYGFKVDPTPAYSGKTKGKVESGVKYVKRGFLMGREGEDAREVEAKLTAWLRGEAGHRTHGTTGKQPLVQFEREERAALGALPSTPFEPVVWKQATVHADSHLSFDKRLYSVPWKLLGERVWVRATATTLTVYFDDERVATHSRRGPGGRSTVEAHLPEGRREIRQRSRGYWEEQAAALGPEVSTLVKEIFEADEVLYQLRAVQSVVGLLRQYPPSRAIAAARRASFFGITTYAGVKRILVNALDLQPLPVAYVPASSALSQPRFARDVGSLIALRRAQQEVDDEPN